MTGFEAYKFYLICKLHFTKDDFNIFTNKHIKVKEESYKKRNDRFLFEKLAKTFPSPRELIEYFFAVNIFGKPEQVYDKDLAREHHLRWMKGKESFTYIVTSDLNKLDMIPPWESLFDGEIPQILKLYMGNEIQIETMVTIDRVHPFFDSFTDTVAKLFADDIRKLRKCRKIIKISDKALDKAREFLETEEKV